MRKTFVAVLALVAASQALATTPRQRLADARDLATSKTGWVQRAVVGDLEAASVQALAAEKAGILPIVLVETNYYAYLPGNKVQLRMTVNPNGFTAPVTMYLYWQDRISGAKRFYNIAAGGLLPDGEIADLFGAAGAPVAVLPPTLTDFVLLGSAADPADLSWGVDGALGASMTADAPGLFQWVLELRDAAGKRVISRSNAMFSYVTEQVVVAGQITTDQTWVATKRYVLSQFVVVKEPAVLTIEPGTVVYGGDSKASLFITRGAKIIADGTAMRPIIMTSPQKVGARAQRQWGSLILLGRAPVNEPGGEAGLEGLPNQPEYRFGGTDPHDSSGVIRYLRLEFGGFEIEVNQEINGLTCGGIGDGTVIEHMQVHFNKDDAVEFFGGTVNAKYLLFTGIADDGVDADLGWIGNVQFVVAVKSNLNDENDGNTVFEWDNHPQNFELTPRTNGAVYNVTAIGTGSTTVGTYGGTLRRGTAGTFHNVIIAGSRRAPLTIRDDATWNQVPAGELVFDNSILFGNFADSGFPNSADRAQQTRDFVFTTMKRNRNVDPMLAFGAWSAAQFAMPNVMPLEDSPALDVDYVKTPPDNGFFDTSVDFIGGVGPNDNWVLSGWAVFSDN
jgi:hypothetical protein